MEALIVIGILSAIIALGFAMRSRSPSIMWTPCAAPEPVDPPVRPVIEKLCEMIRLNDFTSCISPVDADFKSRYTFASGEYVGASIKERKGLLFVTRYRRYDVFVGGDRFMHTSLEDDAIHAAVLCSRNSSVNTGAGSMQVAAIKCILAYQPKDRREQ